MHLKILGQTIKNDVAVWIIRLDSNGNFAIPNTKSGAKRNLYVLKGSNMEIDGQSISGNSMVTLDSSKKHCFKKFRKKNKNINVARRPY